MPNRAGGSGLRMGLVSGLGLSLMLTVAAAGPRQPLRAGAPIWEHPRVALLPLEDLSGRADAGTIFTRILFSELVKTGSCQVVESGIVEAAMDSLSIRHGGSLSREQIRALGERLDARYLMTGSLLESGMTRTPDGEVPSAGVALKLLEVATERVVWAEMRFRTGEDRETIFGWGRVRSQDKLSALLAADVMRNFHLVTADSTARRKRGSK